MCTYGQTELGGPVLFGKPGGHPNALVPWVKYDLLHDDTTKDEGQLILIDNLSTTAGYLQVQKKTHSPNYFHTGDIFRYGMQGSSKVLFYVCRQDDLIKHVTGEFTNPLVTEHAVMNACVGLVNAVCMVGNRWPHPWLLAEISDGVSTKDAMEKIKRILAKT